MNILYIGDIMGRPGIEVLKRVLPDLNKAHPIDLVIAQAENVTEGKGMSRADYKTLHALGVDFFTGGNWSLYQRDLHPALEDPVEPVVRPANYPLGTPGKGAKFIKTDKGLVLVVSLLGQIVGRDADKPVDNPLHIIDQILASNNHVQRVATVVNFHGDFSSEKRVIGYYLDGRASLVVGDHWHVPTADAMVLPAGTAHISDVGMCGSLHSSLGIKTKTIMDRWRHGIINKNEIEHEGPLQFNAVLADIDESTGLARSITQIQKIIPNQL